ncbi:MAG: hypothetical protein PQJ58_06755 [Spirochaetales bacterium]|nr:hypothetical protein [Spirochaetales bacterium]
MKKNILVLLLIMTAAYLTAEPQTAQLTNVTESSVLKEGNTLYSGANALLESPAHPWVPEGEAVGATLSLYFEELFQFDEIQIINGFAHGNDYYGKNNRVAQMTVFYEKYPGEWQCQKTLKLEDGNQGWQSIKMDSEEQGEQFHFRIDDIYKGYKYNDTCLGAVRFLLKGEVVAIQGVDQALKSREFFEKAKEKTDWRQYWASLDDQGHGVLLYVVNETDAFAIIFDAYDPTWDIQDFKYYTYSEFPEYTGWLYATLPDGSQEEPGEKPYLSEFLSSVDEKFLYFPDRMYDSFTGPWLLVEGWSLIHSIRFTDEESDEPVHFAKRRVLYPGEEGELIIDGKSYTILPPGDYLKVMEGY